ncbi:MAG: AAA family ATPase [Deltaproteobacteria bacterium]|nr:AAA family ATPase [Deltaproteobacteria bacterium]
MDQPTRFGSYEIVRSLGPGDLGERFVARREESSRLVVLETFSPELMERRALTGLVEQDARAALGIDHPNLVGLIDQGKVEGVSYVVHEHVRGATAAEILAAAAQRNVRLSPRFVAAVMGEAALGLDAAHRAVGSDSDGDGVPHGSLDASKIWIRIDGLVKVDGIGQAKTGFRLAGNPRQAARTLAPEQLLGQPATFASDQFSLGVVLYELLTQETFSTDAKETLSRAGTELSTGDGALDEILSRLVAIDPSERYESCGAAAEALLAFAAQAGGADAQFKRRMLTSLLGKLEDRTSQPTVEATFVPGFVADRAAVCGLCLSTSPSDEPTCRSCGGNLLPDDSGSASAESSPPKREPAVGRHAERLRAERVIGASIHRVDDRVVVFVGGPGSGKTRLLEDLEAACKRRRVVPLMLPVCEIDAEGHRLVRTRVAAAARAARLEGKQESLDSWIEAVERGPDRATTGRPRILRADPRLSVSNHRAAMIHALTLASEGRPICVLVDDLELADEELVTFLSRLSRVTRGRVGVIATTRDSSLGTEIPGERVALGPLTDTAILDVLQSTLGAALPPILIDDVVTSAEGSPGSAALLGRWLRGAGSVNADGITKREGIAGIEWPPTQKKLVAACLAQLNREARAIAVTGALMSPSFSPKVVLSCVGELSDPKRAVRECLKSGLMNRSSVDEKKIGYDQIWIRQALAECVPDAKRGALRSMGARALIRGQESLRAAALALAEPGSSEDETRQALAAVNGLGLDPGAAKVLKALLEAKSFSPNVHTPEGLSAVTTLATFDPDAASRWLDVAVRADAPVEWSTYDAVELRASVKKWLGDPVGAEAELVSKSELSVELEGESGTTALFDLLAVAEAAGTPEALSEAMSAAIALHGPPELDLALMIGRLLLRSEDPMRARSWLEGVGKASEARPELRAEAHLRLAELQLLEEKADSANGEADRAEALAERSGSIQQLASANLIRGRALLSMSRFEPAKKALAKAADLFADLGQSDEASEAQKLVASVRLKTAVPSRISR